MNQTEENTKLTYFSTFSQHIFC